MSQMSGFDDGAFEGYHEDEEINHGNHAGKSSAIVDGAAITLIGNKAAGESLGLKPRFRIRAAAIHGTDPTIMIWSIGSPRKLRFLRLLYNPANPLSKKIDTEFKPLEINTSPNSI